MNRRIPLIKPFVNDETKSKVFEVLESGYLTEGAVTRAFEAACRKTLGVKHCIAVTSCTVGLETALRCLEVGPGDEVIVPDYTYPATACAVNVVGANIVIVDVEPESMLIDYDKIEKAISARTKAIVPVSLFGNPLDYDRLFEIKEKYGIHVIEDAACSIGAEFKGTRVGNFSDITVFSLHPRKFITTGEGGLIVTDNCAWAEWMESYKHFGIGLSPTRLDTSFERIGTNFKLSDVLAAIGLVQMNHFEELLKTRKSLAENYIGYFENCSGVRLPLTTPLGTHSYQSFCLHINCRNSVMEYMIERGIEVQIGTYALHMQKAFKENRNCRIVGDMSGSLYAFDHCLTLPLYNEMTQIDQQQVVRALSQALRDCS